MFTGEGVETDYSNVFEYSDLFTSNGDTGEDYEYFQDLETDTENEEYYDELEEDLDIEDYYDQLGGDFENEEYYDELVVDLENEDYDYPATCITEADSESNETFSVLNSVTYVMTSTNSSHSATIVMQRISGLEDQVNLVCNFSSSCWSSLSRGGCVPEIYLVSGHSSCSSLPQTVTAKKLAEIHQTGAGQTLVDISWPQLTSTCVIIVRRTSCADGEDNVDSTTETPEDTTLTSFRDICDNIRIVPDTLFRTFTTINLSGFTILLSGSTGNS